MKLTKEDLMRLPKERLAELLVETQESLTLTSPITVTYDNANTISSAKS